MFFVCRLKDEKFAAVYSSDLTRTMETTQIILAQNEGGADQTIMVANL